MDLQREMLREMAETLIDDDVHQMLQANALKRHEVAHQIQQGMMADDVDSEAACMDAYLHIKPRLIKLLQHSDKLGVEFEIDDLVEALMTVLFEIEDKYLGKLQGL